MKIEDNSNKFENTSPMKNSTFITTKKEHLEQVVYNRIIRAQLTSKPYSLIVNKPQFDSKAPMYLLLMRVII